MEMVILGYMAMQGMWALERFVSKEVLELREIETIVTPNTCRECGCGCLHFGEGLCEAVRNAERMKAWMCWENDSYEERWRNMLFQAETRQE